MGRDGTQTRDFLYIDDVVTGHFLAPDQQVEGTFNISSAQETSVNEIYQALMEHFGIDAETHVADFPFEELKRSCLDNSDFARLTGWYPNYSFADGIEKTIQWNRDYYKSNA